MKDNLESPRARPTQDAQLQLARTTPDPYAKRTDAQSEGQVWFVPGYSSPVKVERAFKELVDNRSSNSYTPAPTSLQATVSSCSKDRVHFKFTFVLCAENCVKDHNLQLSCSPQLGDRGDGAELMWPPSGKRTMSLSSKPGSCCFICTTPCPIPPFTKITTRCASVIHARPSAREYDTENTVVWASVSYPT